MNNKPLKVHAIGIAGRMRSGKDAIADIIKRCTREYNQSTLCLRVAFGDAVKEALINTFGIDRTALYTQEGKASYNKEWDMLHRTILTKFGTDAVRDHFHTDAWIFAWKHLLTKLLSPNRTHVVITPDVRFPNEVSAIRATGGSVIWVERSSIDRSGEVHQHISEHAITKEYCDIVIHNDGTLEELEAKVRELYPKIMKPML